MVLLAKIISKFYHKLILIFTKSKCIKPTINNNNNNNIDSVFLYSPCWPQICGSPFSAGIIGIDPPHLTIEPVFKKFSLITLFYVYRHFIGMYMYVPCTCLVPMETKGGHQMPWNWSYRCLWTIMWILRIEPESSAREKGALRRWALPTLPQWTGDWHLPDICHVLLLLSMSVLLFFFYLVHTVFLKLPHYPHKSYF